MDAWAKYGRALYLLLLHANFLDEPADSRLKFASLFADAVTSVPEVDLAWWINSSWREQLVAAWIIAANPIVSLRDRVAKKLLASATCFAGQGLCIATARYRDQRALDDLKAYLHVYLPVGDREYDQEWCVGSLAWLDKCLNTNHSEIFLSAQDNWKVTSHGRELGALNPERGIERVGRAMAFLDELSKAGEIQTGGE